MKVRVCLAMFLMAVVLTPYANAQTSRYDFRYHDYDESTAMLRSLAQRYPNLAKFYSIGTSVIGNRELWCIEIGNQETGTASSEDKRT